MGTPIFFVNRFSVMGSSNNTAMTIGQRLKQVRKQLKLTQIELAARVGLKQSTLSDLELGKSAGTTNLAVVAHALGVNALWLETGRGTMDIGTSSEARNSSAAPLRRAADFDLSSEDGATVDVDRIEYWDAKGSCGGGFLNYTDLPKGHLVKEKTFFAKYGLLPENAFAIYADGDSMADFIVDGDIVIFDKSKTAPRSGKIFAIEHPDGLRIKSIRRNIDGSWILESRNADKRIFPDETIPPDQVDLLKILGEFVYRQGG